MKEEIKEYTTNFHNLYEKLAPNYGYETRKDTKELDFNSNNGKLMYAVVDEIISPLLNYITNLQEENASKDYTIKEFIRANNQLQVEKEQLNSLVNSCQKEIRKLKKLCDKYEEEHKTTFEEWKKDINIIDELEKFLDGKYNEWKDSENENIRESAYEDLRILEYLKELKGENK